MPMPPPARRRRESGLLAAAIVATLWCAAAAAAAVEARFYPNGPPLDPIAGKLADRRWLVAHLLDPARFQPGTLMPNAHLTTAQAADIAAYLYSRPRPPAPPAPRAAGDATRGARLFVERGCRGCHAVAPGEAAPGPTLAGIGYKVTPAWTAAWIRAPRAYHPRSPMPVVAVSDAELADLLAYLATLRAGEELLASGEAPAGNAARGRELVKQNGCNACHQVGELPPPFPPVVVPEGPLEGEAALAAGRSLVAWYRCQGCHEIEGEGGLIRAHLAGESQAPPRLDGEGRRVQPSWLRSYLRQPSVLRPWLHLRMPDYGFGAAEADALAAYLAALDGVRLADEPVPSSSAETIAAGGRQFDAYRCVQCHPLAGQTTDIPAAERAIDLTLARRRLRPSWIPDFLAHPAAIAGPQTRMPAVFYGADGKPAVADPATQIENVSAYLLHMDERRAVAPPPTAGKVDWSTVEY